MVAKGSVRVVWWGRVAAWLAVTAVLLSGLPSIPGNGMAATQFDARVLLDVGSPGTNQVPHAHSQVICRSSKSHAWLEQRILPDAPDVPAILPSDDSELGARLSDVRLPWPRAPTLPASTSKTSFDPRGPPAFG